MSTQERGRYFLIGIVVVVVIFFWMHLTRIDYMKSSQELETVIKQKLLEAGLTEKDLQETYNEEKAKGRIKWIYFTKKFRVSKDFSFQNCRSLIESRVRTKRGRIIFSEINSSGKTLTLKIGIRKIVTHLLIFERTSALARIAIIIDDFGFNKEAMEEFLQLNYPITFSVLPYLKYSKIAAELAHKSGKEVILHLPLQGVRNELNVNVITISMEKDEIEKKVEDEINQIPHIDGVSNHMGSIVTADTEIMRVILEKIKGKRLFFVDSKTTGKSVGYNMAREMGIKTGERKVFLDIENPKDTGYIKKQIWQLVKIAKKDGEAIGIGHNRIWTAYALKEELPKMQIEGIELIFASQIVK
ncbi:hypothetical protein COS91_03425 [Candidatus Desantisbacteria bacterium CG07_land_8_20_14_0_80_39_15]|uniref:Divergent polysaccharide deacetylase family protein n=1 Tax=Candidatus Desantisbacteria bacterium CG07_land_8_20_14_0_80_39_15 TaxID=1974549 RepID=A0A2M6ZGW3_9BACT|nr:MAG: hypothetical protein COS91_03425 [Candidatus Desantisbacteria bacterium CG07_land_8_20_14_0_80_39_15]